MELNDHIIELSRILYERNTLHKVRHSLRTKSRKLREAFTYKREMKKYLKVQSLYKSDLKGNRFIAPPRKPLMPSGVSGRMIARPSRELLVEYKEVEIKHLQSQLDIHRFSAKYSRRLAVLHKYTGAKIYTDSSSMTTFRWSNEWFSKERLKELAAIKMLEEAMIDSA